MAGRQVVNPHDRFFRQVFADAGVAADFMRNYLPDEVVRLLDLSSPEVCKDSFVDEELQALYSDLLYRVGLRGGGGAYVYVLFEHKSYPERLVALHLLRYMLRVWEQGLRQGEGLVPVVPVVVYHGRARWRVGQELKELFAVPVELQRYLPNYRYELCDLGGYSEEEIKGEVLLRATLLLLKYIFAGLRERMVDVLRLLNELADRRTALEYLEVMLRYVAQASEEMSEEELGKAVKEAFPEGGDKVPTIAQRWIEQGRKQGLKQGLERGLRQGLERGIREGLLEAIELDLEVRFGLEGLKLLPLVRKIEDVDHLRAIKRALLKVRRADDLLSLLELPSEG